MPTNRTKRTRKARPPFDPFDFAIVTGGPLPEKFDPFRAVWRVEHPDSSGLLAVPGYGPLADVFRQVHGRPMTDADADVIRARWPEIRRRRDPSADAEDARIAALPSPPRVGTPEYAEFLARHREQPAGPSNCNWPEGTADDFKPIARLTDSESDR